MLSLSSTPTPTTTFLTSLRHFTTTVKPITTFTTTTIFASSSNYQYPNLIIPGRNNPNTNTNSNSNSTPTTTATPQNLYQPYRPPPSPLPSKYRNLDTAAIIDVLTNRLGLWFEYAPLISSLFRDGFTPPTIEELTGISGVEQNRLVVAAQVRDSLADPSSGTEPETLAYFDNGGSELLYEIRLLSTAQRVAAANYIVSNGLFDTEKARDIARSVKDFPSRQNVPGWDKFDYSKTGDCWAFTYLRQSREFTRESDKRVVALTTALEVAETEEAKARITEELEGKKEGGAEKGKDDVRVPVVRLKLGEVAEATSVVVLPVCKAEEKESAIENAPFECNTKGEFGVVVADKGWDRWVVLPRWFPVAGMGPGGVAVEFQTNKALPWRVNRVYVEEAMLVVADRGRREVTADDGFYLVVEGDGLKVERGLELKEMGVGESLGMVLIVVRPPRDESDDQLGDEDWD